MRSIRGAPVELVGCDAGFRFTALPPDCDEVNDVCVCVGMVFLVGKQLLLGFPLIKSSFSEF